MDRFDHRYLPISARHLGDRVCVIPDTEIHFSVYFPDSTWGEESRFGYPFTMVLRDILQYDNNVDDSITRLANTKRTCNLLFGVGIYKKAREN